MKLRHILYSIFMLVSSVANSAETHIVCQGDTKQYWVDSVAGSGSSYSWQINGVVVQNTFALFRKTWDIPGMYRLTVVESNSSGCLGIEQEIFVQVTGLPGLQAIGQGPPSCNSPGSINFSFVNVPDGSYNIIYSGGEFRNVVVSGATAIVTAPPGLYENIAVSVGNCVSTDVVNISIIPLQPPVITNHSASPSINFQPNGELHINADVYNPPLQYSIDGVNWQTESDFFGLLPGPYTVIVRDAKYCEDQMVCEVPVMQVAEMEITSTDGILCLGAEVREPVFTRNFSSIASFEIRFTYNPSVVEFADIEFKHHELESGIMNVTSVPGEVILNWSTAGSVSVPDGLLFDMLFISKAQGSSDIAWDPAEYLVLTGSGYQVPTLFSPGNITIRPTPLISSSGGGSYCEGDETIINVTSSDQQDLDFLWDGPNYFNSTSAEYIFNGLTLDQAGIYTMTASNTYGCSAEESIELVVNPGVKLSIAETEELCAGLTHLLDAGSEYESYLWNTGSTLPSIEVSDTGVYTVEVENFAGCKGSASVELIPCTLDVLFPNAFRPDGQNGTFRPVVDSDNVPISFNMQIFNKWGERIFETNNYQEGWNGKINGSDAPADVYIFIINFKVPGHLNSAFTKPVTGHVVLLR